MKNFTTQRPWAPLAAARVPATALGGVRVPVASVHGVQQPITAPISTGNKGTSGFAVKDVPVQQVKQGMDVRGVPPRGRPV
jgi:hypothetical protein